MRKKIIGVTVGTPTSPARMENEIKPVKTVNDQAPDENGNVEVVGNNGADGKDGADGFSPTLSVSTITGGHRITITDKNSTKNVDVMNGTNGKDGVDGKDGADGTQGPKGDKGDKGDTGAAGANGTNGVSATHSWNGTTLTITSASGTSSANLKGEKGDTGSKGDTGAQGPPGEKGDPGEQGPPGKDGTSVTVKTSYADDNVTFIEFSDGSSIGIPNGSNEWIINVTPVEDTQGTGKILTFRSGAQVRINDGHTPVKGKDFSTDADKAEMVSAVLAALPNAEGVEF